MDYNLKYVDEISGITGQYRSTLVNYFAKLPESGRIHAFMICVDLLNKNITSSDDKYSYEKAYTCFIKALQKMKLSESMYREQNEESEKLSTLLRGWKVKEMARLKPSRKKAFIELHFHDLVDLKKEGRTWREIENYLQKTYKIKIGFSYLRKVYAEIEYERIFNK